MTANNSQQPKKFVIPLVPGEAEGTGATRLFPARRFWVRRVAERLPAEAGRDLLVFRQAIRQVK